MDETRVRNFQELHESLQPYRDDLKWVFRGQRNDPNWRLQPKAGRGGLQIPDENLFRAWKRWAAAYEGPACQSDWDWLAIAQHYGLATRLLDWTMNPLAAAFFAIRGASEPAAPKRDASETDKVIFAYYDPRAEDAGLAREPTRKRQPMQKEPFELEGIKKVRPRYVTKSLQVQAGIFTIHNPPHLCLEDEVSPPRDLRKIVIERSYVDDLKRDLSPYGINEQTLFPDLDGLARHMNWWYGPDRHRRPS